MTAHRKTDQEWVRETKNTARFFTEQRHIAWVLLVGTLLFGAYGYLTMPKRKDPDVPVRGAAVIASWPGARAEDVEELVTRRIEAKLAESANLQRVESTTRTGVAIITMMLDQSVAEPRRVFDELWLRVQSIRDLPAGARVEFQKDFGDTTALMLTVASPPVPATEIQLRAQEIRIAIERARATGERDTRAAVVVTFSSEPEQRIVGRIAGELSAWLDAHGASDARVISGRGFVGVDMRTAMTDAQIHDQVRAFVRDRLRAGQVHADAWPPVVVRDPAETEARLGAVAAERYSHRALERYTERLQRRLQAVPLVSRVSRTGVLREQFLVEYSQQRLASFGISLGNVRNALAARSQVTPAGAVALGQRTVAVDARGLLHDARDVGNVVVGASQGGNPVHLRDVADVSRGYETPRFLGTHSWRDANGTWRRGRAITLGVYMRQGAQIAELGAQVDAALASFRTTLPPDLIVARTSDQPRQVDENVSLFMSSLLEAIVLVVLVALIGFWEWRSALLMALSIPVTLAMTFGMMRILGIDVQQVSIGGLIIALGLLVDDPVVAGDAIKRELAAGNPPIVAAWLGPTKLAAAILFATITNIVAYLPFLAVPDDMGKFIYAMPIVLTSSLVASRLVSMTFVPLLGYHLLRRPKQPELTPEERRTRGFARHYSRAVGWALNHRFAVLAGFVALFGLGVWSVAGVKTAFFPKDLSYLSYVDVWLPEDAPLSATRQAAERAEAIIRRVAAEQARARQGHDGERRDSVLRTLTTFVGGGGPRFWYSLSPELMQANYAQIVMEVNDKHDTAALVAALQEPLARELPGARVDARQLESAAAVGVPVSVRISGESTETLRRYAARLRREMAREPALRRARDSWGSDALSARIAIHDDRAAVAGVGHSDVGQSTAMALEGAPLGTVRDGDLEIPIVARSRPLERAEVSSIDDLYVGTTPLRQIARTSYQWQAEKIVRRNHHRTITIAAFPAPGLLPSEALAKLRPAIERLRSELPPGYELTIAGEHEEQTEKFGHLAVVLVISVLAIFIALVFQLKSATKPIIVFAAIPFGIVGALAGLVVMDTPFGFMAFLGLISLIGVIVSHIIVLFDFIEERHEEGAPLREALVDAGILRLRPVLVTVAATVLGLFPLAAHGGPLWEPLCYVQIGGLTLATVLTLVLVPVIYAIFVLDLKLVRWDEVKPAHATTSDASVAAPPAHETAAPVHAS
ncbi:MAG: efflux RND transporter permease subunit [Deltaproteobacteria bacterium]|nr:efflux RND transporter permease subunit [Deltaproteobacteria bacterium]